MYQGYGEKVEKEENENFNRVKEGRGRKRN